MSLTSRLAGDLVARRGPPVGRELSPRRLGGGLIGVIDGLIGDELEREGSELQEPWRSASAAGSSAANQML
jgi:hypothetical protein